MKAIIPCAGRGKRLRPLTFTNAKPVIPIANKPILLYAIESIKKVGITEIGLVVGDTINDIRDVLKDGSQYGVNLTYIHQEKPLGISHTIMVSQDFLGDESFVMYLGDNLLEEDITEPVRRFKEHNANGVIVLYPTDKPELFGIAVVENDRVTRLVEKPKDPPSNLAAIGIYVFDKSIHPIVNNLKPSARGELEITDAIQGLIDSGAKVEYHTCQGWWIDAGNPDDMIEANRLVLQNIKASMNGQADEASDIRGNVIIGGGTTIRNSTIRGPVIIGENCEISDSFVGSFTSIGSGSKLGNCEVEYSVVMENCEIDHVDGRIDHSILGRNVKVSKAQRRPRSYKLVLSDESAAQLM